MHAWCRLETAQSIGILCNRLKQRPQSGEWLLALPLCHFLRGSCEPFGKPEMDPENIRWGREEGLDIREIRAKLQHSKEGYVGKVYLLYYRTLSILHRICSLGLSKSSLRSVNICWCLTPFFCVCWSLSVQTKNWPLSLRGFLLSFLLHGLHIGFGTHLIWTKVRQVRTHVCCCEWTAEITCNGCACVYFRLRNGWVGWGTLRS